MVVINFLFMFFYFFSREVEAWSQTMVSLVTLMEYIDTVLLPRCEDGSLLADFSSSPNELMGMLNTIPQYSFYGRCLGFHVRVLIVLFLGYGIFPFIIHPVSIQNKLCSQSIPFVATRTNLNF